MSDSWTQRRMLICCPKRKWQLRPNQKIEVATVLTFFFRFRALKITSLHFSTSLRVLNVLDIVDMTLLSELETLTDWTGESTATGDRLSSRFGRFRIWLAGLVAILKNLPLSKASGLLKFKTGISELVKTFPAKLSPDWLCGVWGDFAALG